MVGMIDFFLGTTADLACDDSGRRPQEAMQADHSGRDLHACKQIAWLVTTRAEAGSGR